MVEIDFVNECLKMIEELKELIGESDSREMKTYYQGRLDVLQEFSLPQAKLYHYNLGVLSECRDKLIRKLQE
jgi:hypothetical protein